METIVKSPEQKIIEHHLQPAIEKIKRQLMLPDFELEIKIKGVPIHRLGEMARFMEEGFIDNRKCAITNEVTHYIRKPFEGIGFKVDEISE